MTATAVDAAGTTVSAEWFDGPDPGAGSGIAMTPVDGAFDQPTESIAATIDAAALTPGTHTISVRAKDAAGNWGAPATTTLLVDLAGPVLTVVTRPTARSPRPGHARRVPPTRPPGSPGRMVRREPTPAPARPAMAPPTAPSTSRPKPSPPPSIPLPGPGAHPLAVRARDAAGNSGAPTTTTLVIDRAGPVVAGLVANPNPTNLLTPSPFDLPAGNATTFALTATATDGNSTVTQAEWFTGADPGPGNGTAVDVAGASLRTAIDSVALGWLDGSRAISVRARDALGNWGAPVQVSVAIVRPNVIFRNGFESGSASSWSTTTGAGRLAFVSGANLAGTGVRMRVNLTGPIAGARPASAYLTDNSPVAEATYHPQVLL